MIRRAFALGPILVFCCASIAANPFSESAVEKDAYPNVRESMITMSRQLGVTCTYCHDIENFKSSTKPTFKIAKTHMGAVESLNAGMVLGGKMKADCFMCHRGEAKYIYAEIKQNQ